RAGGLQILLQNTALMQSVALLQTVPAHLVKQGPQTHAEAFRRFATIAANLAQGGGDRVAFRGLDDVRQRDRTPGGCVVRGAWRAGEVTGLENIPVGQYHGSLDRILELAHVAPPLLL